ncbi:Vacuolar protein sorting-associated protein 51-like protein [Sciurus carolinensis]|uniref:Vacuolar protein sorting-associated protein 51 homolog n=1 Tax=Sciurus carolinensis TaxID=30640 RepID=A0AA41N0A5_SCICA|nr:Vacuolar protein sorting-associated protein 51-like protein [Sciurus carolinensis]
MGSETDMVRQSQALDSDKQTLVYANYKFISVTETIRNTKNDFRKMEDEMDRLATNMAVITNFRARISATLQDERITKLAGIHALLRKLQFLLELPSCLTKCVELGAYRQALHYQGRARAIKISLKTLLECVRQCIFGCFGLQQVQVDCHFLRLYLWHFMADEELVHLLLDLVVASAALRCPDPLPMEPSVVEVICECG